MRSLLASTGFSALAAALAFSPAAAETVVSTAVTTPLATGTDNDDIRITSTGSVKPTGGAAVTINSDDSVRNEGVIAIAGANNATGILANTNLSGNITNAGTITIDENYTPTDSDDDGDVDGPFAQGTNRFGIHVLGGGTFTGSVINSGAITVEGNQSAAIAIDSALTGSIRMTAGAISVLGNDSVGIRAGDVSGDVSLTGGAIAVKGGDSVGVALNGDIGGALVIQNTIASTGYRSTTAPAETSKLDADDLLQGGSAVVVGGDVAGGILFDARPKDSSTTDDDEDDDGVKDAQESTATITSFGSAAAVRIGSADEDVTVGSVGSSASGHGLVVKGSINGVGVYTGVSATGLHIGGTGHATDIAGGMTVDGGIGAKAMNANATAVHIGAGASVPAISVGGNIIADGGGTASTGATAIRIDSGATVTSLTNSGTIRGVRSGTAGTAAAIVDHSGTLSLIDNRGFIGVSDSQALGDSGVAFDLSANTGGVTVRQLAVAAGKTAPAIAGTMLFGSGADVLDVRDGSVTGAAKFGIGANRLLLSGDAAMRGKAIFGGGADVVQLGDTASFVGDIDFGGGADSLTLAGTSLFSGKLANSGGLAVSVGTGATFAATNTGTVSLGSLALADGATLGVTLQGGANAVTLYDVAGEASFGTGSTVAVNVLSLGGVAGTYKILRAGTLTGAGNLTTDATGLPFLYGSSLSTATPGEVSLVVRLKSAAELGLNASEGSILGAIVDSADADAPLAAVFLGIDDQETLSNTIQQMLPEHAGGTFETVTKGSRLTADILLDEQPAGIGDGPLGLWAQQVAWGTSKSIGSTASYDLTGWGASAGVERRLGSAGAVGLSLAYLAGSDRWNDNDLMSSQYEAGLYWRGGLGPLRGFARATAATIEFDGQRNFFAEVDGEPVTRSAEGDWSGRLYSAAAGVSYLARMGRFSLRPTVGVEHYSLSEKGYAETGGGEAFDLDVRKRDSDETAATASLGLGFDLLGLDPREPWFRVEIEGGRRQILSGSLGATVASFGDNDPFTLTAEERTSGWTAALRAAGGGSGMTVTAEVGGEEQQGEASIGGRIGLQLAL